jgi:hypothetical protein
MVEQPYFGVKLSGAENFVLSPKDSSNTMLVNIESLRSNELDLPSLQNY